MRIKLKKIFLAIFLLTIAIHAQTFTVTFRVEAHNLNDSEKVFIAGNQGELGDWSPGAIELNKISASYREITCTFPAGTELAFKFTKGSWEKEAVYKAGEIPSDFTLTVTKDTVFFTRIEMWRNGGGAYTPPDTVTGTVEFIRNVSGTGVRPRDIVIWLPPDYYKNPDERYPVLYMHDGQNLFNPALSSFGRDWQLDETSDSLIRNGITQPFIIVGIYNTQARYIEYSDNDTGQSYMRFITETLKPMIDMKYRTLPGRENTATGGSSMGGLISFMLLWEHNDVFSKAMCMSPAFSYRDFDYTAKVLAQKDKDRDMIAYIDNGGIALELVLQPGVDKMLSVLEARKYVKNKDFYCYIFPEAEHNEPAWAKRTHIALKLFFGR